MDLQEYKYVSNFKEMVTPIFDLEVYFYQDNESVIRLWRNAWAIFINAELFFYVRVYTPCGPIPHNMAKTFDGPPTL